MKYIALTIGPIYKTLKNSKKTRELWGGSYIFSYIMKQIILKFEDRDFVTPYIKDKT
ncbi:type III-B CRISPR-associated protein Cas10/Cmr2, partial [Aliarcobacter butzleri]